MVVCHSFHKSSHNGQLSRYRFLHIVRQAVLYISEPSKIFRISNLLDILGIEQRVVTDVDAAITAPTINYEEVNKRLSAYRESSLNYLKSILA